MLIPVQLFQVDPQASVVGNGTRETRCVVYPRVLTQGQDQGRMDICMRQTASLWLSVGLTGEIRLDKINVKKCELKELR